MNRRGFTVGFFRLVAVEGAKEGGSSSKRTTWCNNFSTLSYMWARNSERLKIAEFY